MRRLDFKVFSQEQVFTRLERILDCYPFALSDVKVNGSFRARVNGADQTFEHASELWYPPADTITRRGRLNDIGQSRFYCASEPHTATMEIRPSTGDTITLLLAKSHEDWADISVCFVGVAKSLNAEVLFTRNERRMQQGKLASLGAANYAKFKMSDDLLTDFITETNTDDHRYKLTIALADLLLEGGGLEAIHYPSESTRMNGINMVLSPEKADAIFRPEEAWEVRVESEMALPMWKNPVKTIRPLRRSKPIGENGMIEWREPGDEVTPEDFSKFVQARDIVVRGTG